VPGGTTGVGGIGCNDGADAGLGGAAAATVGAANFGALAQPAASRLPKKHERILSTTIELVTEIHVRGDFVFSASSAAKK
jgi:hypothetical protein